MDKPIIGRDAEIKILNRLLQSKDPELVAVYGRRRVGKTFLIKTYLKDSMVFACSGQLNGIREAHLANFSDQLQAYFPNKKMGFVPATWQQAFVQLRDCINSVKSKKKKVLFFDELPWLDNHKSGFLSAFDYFWNMYASTRSDLLVIICGSAASWMINKIINNKGGLHNRVTKRIRLLPFTLKETEAYLIHRNIQYNKYQLLQVYMVMGGIPHYLNAIEKGKSVPQNIDQICFDKDGLLATEFENLYAALFSNHIKHITIIKALAQKSKGLTRNELLKASKLNTGGGISTLLDELAESGFIEKTLPYNKTERDSLYRLSDEFSLFYYRFMQPVKNNEKAQWVAKSATPAYTGWCGYAFENICIKHINEIKKALGINGIYTSQSSWVKAGNKEYSGTQIDLLIDRNDNCINICEMKFSIDPYVIDKKYAEVLQKKLQVFRQQTGTRKNLMLTFVSTYGVADNEYRLQLVENTVTIDDLFA